MSGARWPAEEHLHSIEQELEKHWGGYLHMNRAIQDVVATKAGMPRLDSCLLGRVDDLVAEIIKARLDKYVDKMGNFFKLLGSSAVQVAFLTPGTPELKHGCQLVAKLELSFLTMHFAVDAFAGLAVEPGTKDLRLTLILRPRGLTMLARASVAALLVFFRTKLSDMARQLASDDARVMAVNEEVWLTTVVLRGESTGTPTPPPSPAIGTPATAARPPQPRSAPASAATPSAADWSQDLWYDAESPGPETPATITRRRSTGSIGRMRDLWDDSVTDDDKHTIKVKMATISIYNMTNYGKEDEYPRRLMTTHPELVQRMAEVLGPPWGSSLCSFGNLSAPDKDTLRVLRTAELVGDDGDASCPDQHACLQMLQDAVDSDASNVLDWLTLVVLALYQLSSHLKRFQQLGHTPLPD